jgi:thiosulfate/3-mercaptopyruvate sulfurtransferase
MTSRPLIAVADLDEALRAPADQRPALLDVRWEPARGPRRDEYAAGHIPGAAFVDLDAALASPPGPGGRHPLPTEAQFEAAMRAAGVSNPRPVVVYDAATAMAAARAWWLLRYFGHQRVSVLDGGLAAWVEAGLPVEHGDADRPDPSDFDAHAGAMATVDASGAAGLARAGTLLDARAADRFRGEVEPLDRVAGHIPGARNRPTALNVDPSGRFLDAGVLRDAFGATGVAGSGPVGAYCGSGITAAHQVLALELAGFQAALYPGSWSEWITDPSRAVAGGP